ncbi:hypothetical protein TA3x_003859 [Tundrisphaera sp. TA3]|uniref:hypothetical protein n=1 Tax=Tundrisphaera sp. TA3 TaxID=3435775 RepID=UPI003EBAA2E1
MPKAKKPDEVVALSERMIEALASLRSRAGGDDPPTLARLAEQCGIPPGDDRVLKAAGKKPFTARATALKRGGKVGLDSPVYFKEDVPSKVELERREVADLAGRMLRVLESQRDLGEGAYPPTLSRLADLSGVKPSNPLIPKAIKHETMAEQVVIANTGKPAADALIFLVADLVGNPGGWGTAMLDYAFAKLRKSDALGFTPDQLAKKLQKSLRKPFLDELTSRLRREDLPESYAWLPSKKPLIFRRDDIRPGEPFRVQETAPAEVAAAPPPAHVQHDREAAPARDFESAFREAFERIDQGRGRTNNVKLSDLRRELAGFDRPQFDAGLRRLRERLEFSLDSHEGLVRPLTAEEREAGISESGSLLVYVSRR